MHGLSFMIGVPGEILAVLLLSLALRSQTAWVGLPLLSLTAVIWLSLAVMVAAIIISMKQHGIEGPGIVGWANRAPMVGYSFWLMVAAWPIARV